MCKDFECAFKVKCMYAHECKTFACPRRGKKHENKCKICLLGRVCHESVERETNKR